MKKIIIVMTNSYGKLLENNTFEMNLNAINLDNVRQKIGLGYACLWICISFFSYFYTQAKTDTLYLFDRKYDGAKIQRINSDNNIRLFYEEPFIDNKEYLIFVSKEPSLHIDSVENMHIYYVQGEDTIKYYPYFPATALYYTKDTLFASYGHGIALFLKKNKHFIFDKALNFNSQLKYDCVIGHKGSKLIVGAQSFNGKKNIV